MHLGAWPGGSWLPWRAAPLLLCSCSCLVFKRLPQEWSYLSFHLLTCTMGFAPIKWTCTAFFRPRQLTDRAILANRQTQEKKTKHTPPASPVSHNPNISRGNDIKESVEKALSFQRSDPAAMRAALQAVGEAFDPSSSQRHPECLMQVKRRSLLFDRKLRNLPSDRAILAERCSQQKKETAQLAGTTGNAEPALGPIAGTVDTPINNPACNKGMAEGKRPAAAAGLEDIVVKKFTSNVTGTPSASDRSDEQARILPALEIANEDMSRANAKL